MNGNFDSTVDAETIQADRFPADLRSGLTILIASAGDPSRYAVGLRALCVHGSTGDSSLVVTTTQSADRTISVYDTLEAEAERPSIGIVDTSSEEQSLSALYNEYPVVFVPSPGDLERLVLALSDLFDNTTPTRGDRHFIIRSLTPIIAASSVSRVRTVLGRITGLRSETGLGLVGIDYTAHDEETMTAIADLVDGVLWVTQPSPDRLAFDYQPTRERHIRSVLSSDLD